MTWAQFIESVIQAVTAGAVVWGVVVATKGVSAWRRETLGKREIEMAERAIPVFAAARAAIREARNPFVPVGELVEVYRVFNDGKDPEDGSRFGKIEHTYYAPIHRLQKQRDTFAELDSLAPLFMAYFGDDAEAWFEAIKKAHIKVQVTANSLIGMARSHQLDGSRDTVAKFEDVIWNMDEEDELGRSVKDAQQAAYARCREKLRAPKGGLQLPRIPRRKTGGT